MALLDLVDRFLGDILRGNVFTDIDVFQPTMLPRPGDVDTNIPQLLHPDISEQAEQISKPLDPIIPKDAIYQSSDSGNRVGGRLSDLIAFHESKVPDFELNRSFGSDAPLGGNRDDLASKHHEQRAGSNTADLDVYNNRLSVERPHGLIDKVETSDGHRGGQVYAGSYTAVPGPAGQALKYIDVIAAAKWFENIGREGIPLPLFPRASARGEDRLAITTEAKAKSLTWNISQFLLASFNPTDTAGYGELNAVWNPLSFTLSVVPFLRSTPATNITVGAAAAGVGFSGYGQNVANSAMVSSIPGGSSTPAGERLLQMRNGAYKKSIDGTTIAQLGLGDAGFKGDLTHVGMGSDPNIESTDALGALASIGATLVGGNKAASIQEQVDSDDAKKKGIHGNIYTSDNPYSAVNSYTPLRDVHEFAEENPDKDPHAYKLAQLFSPTRYPTGEVSDFGSLAYNFVAKTNPIDSTSPTQMADAPGLNAATTDVGFTPEDFEKGVVADVIAEDAIYMPFMFQDLRDTEKQFLYFRAFLKGGISETFTPDWQTERYYGRVDQIPIYQGTIRSVSLAFDVVAWKPADLPTMWRKLEKLQSMVYPFYNTQGFLNAGPIIRMRIGDLFAATDVGGSGVGSGLPGYITSMDWSFDDGIWNLATDFKVPRKVTISLGFTVLHNGNPGTYPFQEGDFPDDGSDTQVSTDGVTFGAGKVERKERDKNALTVSRAEIRKIFDTVKPTES